MEEGRIILAVDDNVTVTRFIASVLRPMGFRVDTASDGVEALARLTRGPVDLILLDLVMPRMNGVNLCRAIQQKNLAPGATIILLSSAEQEVAERVIKVTQAKDFLPKPVREQQLRAIVQNYLAPPGVGEAGTAEDTAMDACEDIDIDLGGDTDQQPEITSDDTAAGPLDLKSLLRDKLDSAVAAALASKLDEILGADSRDQVLDLLAGALAQAINDDLLDRFIELVQDTGDKAR